ncbi:Gamma-glutamyl hydrolase [Liparis tanakae]|uniref:Gamma-glutamyl hydrolase n=1 Tax=Liparis tanakae TaxID=230148 RepID=A0A4Z2E782_9TELE|nr:Gamma-glutamyl hydrolase [Liparis tanakae]
MSFLPSSSVGFPLRLLLPGGDVNVETSQFSRASRIFYDLALRANQAGDFFPIWGTCQGLQQLSVLTANQNLLSRTLPLNLTRGTKVVPRYQDSSDSIRTLPSPHTGLSLKSLDAGSIYLELSGAPFTVNTK